MKRVLREVRDRLVSTNAPAGFTYVVKKDQPGLIRSPRLDKLTTSLAPSRGGVKVLKSQYFKGLGNARHAKYLCSYHFVRIPKYRRSALIGEAAE